MTPRAQAEAIIRHHAAVFTDDWVIGASRRGVRVAEAMLEVLASEAEAEAIIERAIDQATAVLTGGPTNRRRVEGAARGAPAASSPGRSSRAASAAYHVAQAAVGCFYDLVDAALAKGSPAAPSVLLAEAAAVALEAIKADTTAELPLTDREVDEVVYAAGLALEAEAQRIRRVWDGNGR